MKEPTVRLRGTLRATRGAGPAHGTAWESGHPPVSKTGYIGSIPIVVSRISPAGDLADQGHPWGKPILAAIASIGPTVPL